MVILSAALLSFRSIDDLDYGIHVATGRWILEHGTVPRTDPFTWSIPDHPYVAYHWGFQVLIAAAEGGVGPLGPVLLRSGLVIATVLALVLSIRSRRVDPVLAAGCGLVALVAAEWRFSVRPELFTNLCLAMVLFHLDQRRAGRRLSWWALPLTFVVWVNTHVFVLGLFVLFTEVLGDLLLRRLDRRFAAVTGLCLAALLLNPYGLEAVQEPLRLMTRLDAENVFAQHISELTSPFKLAEDPRTPFHLQGQILAWKALLLLCVPAAWGLLRARRLGDLGVLLAFAALSTLAVRNLPLFAIAALPALVSGLQEILPGFAWRPWRSTLAWIVLAVGVVLCVRVGSGAWYAQQRRDIHLRPIIEASSLAVDAGALVERWNLQGRGFNNLDVGGALLLSAPSHPIYIDGRNEVTGEAFFSRYLATLLPDGFDRLAASSGVEYAVLSHRQCLSLIQHLVRSGRWTLVYYDAVATILVRKDGPNGHLPAASLPAPVPDLERWALLGAIRPRPGQVDSWGRWLLGGEESPEGLTRVGTFLLTMGQWDQAERPLLQAAIQAPDFWETSNNLGALYFRKHLPEPTNFAYRTVLMLEPGNELAAARERESWAAVERTIGGPQ